MIVSLSVCVCVEGREKASSATVFLPLPFTPTNTAGKHTLMKTRTYIGAHVHTLQHTLPVALVKQPICTC